MDSALENGIKYIVLLALLVNIFVYLKSPTKENKNILYIVILGMCIFWYSFVFENSSFFKGIKPIRTFVLIPWQIIFWMNLFKQKLLSAKWRRNINIAIVGYILLLVVLIFLYYAKLNIYIPLSLFSYMYIYGIVALTVTCLLYLNQLSNSKEALTIWSNQIFYLCFAVMFLYLGSMPLHILKSPLVKSNIELLKYYVIFVTIFQYILYLTIIITFILFKCKDYGFAFNKLLKNNKPL